MSAPREARALLIAVVMVVLGLAVARVGFAPFDQRAGWMTVLSAWVVSSSGLFAWLRMPSSRIGPILVIAATVSCVEILVISFMDRQRSGAADIGSSLVWVLLGQAIVAGPTVRRRAAIAVASLVVLYATLVLPLGIAGPVQALAVVASLATAALTGPRPTWPVVAAAAVFVVGAAGLLASVAPAAGRDHRIDAGVAQAAIAALVAGRLVAGSSRSRRIIDFVADLDGSDRARGITRRLATLLDQPDLEIGYLRPEDGRFVDTDGKDVGESASTDRARGMVTTALEADGQTVALARHPPGALTDLRVRTSLARAAGLVVAHRRLRANVTEQLVHVRHSRRRLIDAADEENDQFRRELEDRVGPRLAALEDLLAGPIGTSFPDRARSAADHVRAVRRDIAAILEGLPPGDIEGSGLDLALRALAARSPLAVQISITGDGPRDRATRAALYFSCSEGVANAVRHARATHVAVDLDCGPEHCVLRVTDDGIGGAAIGDGAGTGLLGIRDRLDAIGGRLDIDSRAGRGTRLIAQVPNWLEPPVPA